MRRSKRGVDAQAAFGRQLRAERLLDLAARILDEVRVLRIVDLLERFQRQRLSPRRVRLRRRDGAVLHHQPQHLALAALDRARPAIGLPQFGVGIVVGRRLGQPRQQRRLRQRQLLRRPAEVSLRGGLDAVRQVAVVDLVQIDLQDGVFGVAPRQLGRQDRLLDLAGDRLLRSQKCQLDQLLGDGAAARPREAALLHRVVERAQQPDRIHAGMFVEVRVLGGNRGVQQVGGNPVQRHRGTPAEVRIAHLVEHVPIPIVDQRRGEVAGARLELVGHGQIPGDTGVAHQHDAERQNTQSHDDQHDEGRPSAARSPARRRHLRRLRAHRLPGRLEPAELAGPKRPVASAPAPRARRS